MPGGLSDQEFDAIARGASNQAPPTATPQSGTLETPNMTDAEFDAIARTAAGPQAPQQGPAHDVLWGNLASAGGRILNAYGAGAAQQWGAEPLGLSPEAETGLSKAGIFNDYSSGHTSFIKSANEAFIRPAAAALDFANRALRLTPLNLQGDLDNIKTSLEQIEAGTERPSTEGAPQGIADEIGRGIRGVVHAGAGIGAELAGAAEQNYLGPEFLGYQAAEEPALAATKARALGVIGEGEAGFYGAQPVTPENVQARAEAAEQAGVAPAPPEPPVPDVHALARRIDPETFQEYDSLAAEAAARRTELDRSLEARANSPEALEAQGQIDTILGRVNNVPSRLTNAARARLEEAQGRLDAIMAVDTPEIAASRSALMEADFRMRDLAPDVSEAYRQAHDLMPAPEIAAQAGAEAPRAAEEAGREAAATTEGAGAQAAPERTPEEEAGIRAATAMGATPAGEAETAAPNVVGERLGQARYGNLRAVEGTGETLTRGLSEGVEEKAIEESLTDGFGDLPEYRQLSMADQASQVTAFMDRDYETAKRIAMGEVAPPRGVLPESFYVGVEKRAIAEGDVDTLEALATRSRLTTTATTMGQRIRTLGERDQASPVGALQDVMRARERAVGTPEVVAKAKADTVAELKAEVRKAASKADRWSDFLSTLECQ